MTIRILVNGATGRMGSLTVKTLALQPGFEMVAENHSTDNLAETIQRTRPDVAVDFTRADLALSNLETFMEQGVRPVIGTSGLTLADVIPIQQRFPGFGGIIAPNFSLAAVLAMKYAGEIARYFPDVEIIEMHHDGKLDSPSGTAIRTAEILAEGKKTSEKKLRESKEIIQGARGALHHGIPIHAVRLPGLVAHLQVIFGAKGETLTLRHDTTDRACFMPGVVLACQKVMGLDHLVYGLQEIL